MAEAKRIEVWYDGGCPLCARSRRWAERRDRDGALHFRDFTSRSEAGNLPAPPAELDRAMCVRAPDGKVDWGFAGWRAILAALPRWRWLARVLGWRPLRGLGPRLYRLVSLHRHVLARGHERRRRT
ncbi:MAG: thiol-disulfide oxidoreductase DCC family protein [Acidobacteriota bacterium]